MKKIHLIAICGTGMASLAGLLKEKGYEVTGSDQNIYPPMSDQLAALDISVRIGFRRETIEELKPDIVVIGNAISKNNEEALAAIEKKLPIFSMPQALYEIFLADRIPIVVAGTHGKTTTSGLLAWLLERTGQSPGFFVGGMLKNFEKSYQLGTGKYFVVEGDEYDSAFFDKGPKFLHYSPKILILNSVEFDHADIYRNLEHLMGAFSELIGKMPSDGLIFADGDSPNVHRLIDKAPCRVTTFGVMGNTTLEAKDISFGEMTKFQLVKQGKILSLFSSPLVGRHNLKNLLGVLGVLLELGLRPEEINAALSEFTGVKRRQEVLATLRNITIIDDFAHHPTAVYETLTALREKYPQGRLWGIFEPRSNTTRRRVFQKDFITAFDPADEVIMASPYQIEKIPEADRLDPFQLVEELKQHGKRARYVPSIDEIVEIVRCETVPKDVICLMSNGGFGGIYEKVIRALS